MTPFYLMRLYIWFATADAMYIFFVSDCRQRGHSGAKVVSMTSSHTACKLIGSTPGRLLMPLQPLHFFSLHHGEHACCMKLLPFVTYSASFATIFLLH